jgi:hypothetical protein
MRPHPAYVTNYDTHVAVGGVIYTFHEGLDVYFGLRIERASGGVEKVPTSSTYVMDDNVA